MALLEYFYNFRKVVYIKYGKMISFFAMTAREADMAINSILSVLVLKHMLHYKIC